VTKFILPRDPAICYPDTMPDLWQRWADASLTHDASLAASLPRPGPEIPDIPETSPEQETRP